MKQKKVLIRTDGSSDIGLGHVVRCISLAHMLKNDFSIHFFVLEVPDPLKKEITQNGWDVTIIEIESDFLKSLSENEIVVLDGYHFDSEYQKLIKNKRCKLVCIDDFYDQYFYADLIINHAPGVTKENYESEPYTKYLLGPDYALLRPEFLENTNYMKRANLGDIKRILICFGGSDFKNLTAKVLSWLPSKHNTVTVVLGHAYLYHKQLIKVIKERYDLDIIVKNSLSAKEMKQEIAFSDLAIVPASGILFEVISQRVPVISGFYVENQLGIYRGFKKMQVMIDAKNFERADFLEAIISADNQGLSLIKKNQSLVIDGLSSDRIRNNFKNLTSICV
jgi:UDP-2,4-diacetamido-2,4,6-trideoxy-beta-L-altropyranose hydrolase